MARRRAPRVPRRLVRRRRAVAPTADGFDRTQARRQDWQRRLDDGRWAAINWPRDWHGREATPVQNAIYAEEMARVKAPGIYNANGIWQIGPMILRWGTPEQQDALAARASSRPRSTGARASASPRPGSDLANMRTLALADGDHYVVNGQKTWISSAHLARWGLFLLRTDPDRVRARREARGHHRVHRRPAHARHRVPPDPRHHRRHDAQRGLLHRRGRSRPTAASAARARDGRWR